MLGLGLAVALAFGAGYVANKQRTKIRGVQQLASGLKALGAAFGFSNPQGPSSAATNTGEPQQ